MRDDDLHRPQYRELIHIVLAVHVVGHEAVVFVADHAFRNDETMRNFGENSKDF